MTQVSPDMVEVAARAIATENGDDFDKIHRDKPHWVETRGDLGGPWRDVNALRQVDYLEMAEVALTAALGDKYVIVEKDISDVRLNSLLGRAVDAPVTPMRAMLRDFYRIAIAAPTPEQQQP